MTKPALCYPCASAGESQISKQLNKWLEEPKLAYTVLFFWLVCNEHHTVIKRSSLETVLPRFKSQLCQ